MCTYIWIIQGPDSAVLFHPDWVWQKVDVAVFRFIRCVLLPEVIGHLAHLSSALITGRVQVWESGLNFGSLALSDGHFASFDTFKNSLL